MAVNATAVWRVRPSGSNTNGGGYDPGISGAATDYSQQNSAQASGTAGTAAGTTAFSDVVAAAFTSAMVGNALYITGTGLTTGFYFCTAFTDSSHITIDRSPGTGTTGTWHLGGGWADFWTNTTSTGPLVPGNTVYILGSGVPNPASYTYDYSPTASFTHTSGNATVGPIHFIGDPSTPSNGVPCIKVPSGSSGDLFQSEYGLFNNIWLVASGNNSFNHAIFNANNFGLVNVLNCVVDMFGYNATVTVSGGNGAFGLIGSEVFSSVASRGSTSNTAIILDTNGGSIIGCNIHDCIATLAVQLNSSCITFINNIVAKNLGDGVTITTTTTYQAGITIANNTIDGNAGNGLIIFSPTALQPAWIFNNIISNHTGAGKFGLTVSSGTATSNSLIQKFADFNTYYNNTTNYNAISAGPHDTALGSNPYNGQSTEDYSLK